MVVECCFVYDNSIEVFKNVLKMAEMRDKIFGGSVKHDFSKCLKIFSVCDVRLSRLYMM